MTDNALTLAQDRLLRPGGLDTAGLERTFGQLLGPGVDFGDLYFQHARRESWSVEDGIVKDGAIVVTAQQRADAAAPLVEAAVRHGAAIHAAGEDFGLRRTVPGVGGQLITVQGRAGTYDEVFLPLYGEHQAHNAALAIAAVGAGRFSLDALLRGRRGSRSPASSSAAAAA